MVININLLNSGEIKEGKHRGKAPLRFSLNYLGQRFFIGAGERALITAWEVEAQKVGRKDPDGVEINKRLIKKKALLAEAITVLERKGLEPTQKQIKSLYQAKVDEVFKGLKPVIKTVQVVEKPKLPTTFWEVLEHYRKNSKNTKETIRKFNQIEKHLRDYKADFDFSDLTEDFYNDYFLGYLPDVPVCDNTVDKHISEIKKLCNYANSRFSHIAIPNEFMDYKRMYIDPFRLSLSWDEVKKIEEYKAPNEELALAQDLFLISCYTGLRWQNVSKIKEHNIVEVNGKYYFQGITPKNNKPLQFALSPKVYKILERYSKNIPKAYNYDINKGIQRVAKAVKLKDPVSFTKLYKGVPKVTTVEKWKKVTMHVGRHSFAMRFLEYNKADGVFALQSLKELLGHSSSVITEIYVKMANEQKDRMLLRAVE